MEIDGVSLAGTQAGPLEKPHRTGPVAKQALDEPPEAGEPSPTEPAGEESNDSGKAEGVLRLLQEGHFKGVSDVRLRINFNDELTAIEAAQMQAVSEQKMGGVLESVGGIVDTFLADNELTEEESAAVSDAKDSFLQAVNGANDPASAVADAFAIFLELLQALVPPPPEPEPEDVPPPDDGETEPIPPVDSGPDWQGFIENLQSSFSGAMDDLTTTVNAVSVLPPLSEPSGNGVAYDKFLAIYNEMRGIVPAAQGADVVA